MCLMDCLHFPTLKKMLFIGILCVPGYFPFTTRVICSTGSPMRDAWVFLLWCADYVSSLVSLVNPWFLWLPVCALCRGC